MYVKRIYVSLSASPLAHAHSQRTSWRPAATSGADRTRTRATTPKATCRPTMRECRCCCPIGSWASSWCPVRCPGTTTLWVSSHNSFFYRGMKEIEFILCIDAINYIFKLLMNQILLLVKSVTQIIDALFSSDKSVPYIDISTMSFCQLDWFFFFFLTPLVLLPLNEQPLFFCKCWTIAYWGKTRAYIVNIQKSGSNYLLHSLVPL